VHHLAARWQGPIATEENCVIQFYLGRNSTYFYVKHFGFRTRAMRQLLLGNSWARFDALWKQPGARRLLALNAYVLGVLADGSQESYIVAISEHPSLVFYLDGGLGQYLRPGESPAFFMAPVKAGQLFPDRSMSSSIWLGVLQDYMHDLLGSFLHATLWTRTSRYLYPLQRCREHTPPLVKDLAFLISSVQQGLPGSFLKLSELIGQMSQESVMPSAEVASLLAAFYRDFARVLPEVKVETRTVTVEVQDSIDDAALRATDAGYFSPVLQFKRCALRHLRQYVRGLYLHGSLATLDYVKGYSDFDTLLILKQEVTADAATLMRCRKLLLRSLPFLHMVDPLQHHGHLVLAEQDLSFYPQPYFPFILFQYAQTFFQDSSTLVFQERDSTLERQNALWRFCQTVRQAFHSGQAFRSLYEWKAFIQGVVLLPSIYLQAVGDYTYKKLSFEKAAKDFNEQQWRMIQKATILRREWKATRTLPWPIARALCASPNPFLLPFIHRRLNRPIPRICHTLIGANPAREAIRLSEAMLAIRFPQLVQAASSGGRGENSL
jgi:hypothetical protein